MEEEDKYIDDQNQKEKFLKDGILFRMFIVSQGKHYIENLEKEKKYKNCVHFIQNTGNDYLIVALCEAYKLKFGTYETE